MLPNSTAKLVFLWIGIILLTPSSSAQVVIGTPNLGFSQACANPDFNNYTVSFIFSPEVALSSSNQFTVELSDADGDFSNAIVLATSGAGTLTTSPVSMDFSIPETTAGENYRIRIRSSAPAATSSGSTSFSAYFKPQDSPFTINNLVESAAFCSGGTYLLTIDNPGTGNNDSPLNYPSLTFNWFRETGPTTAILVAQGETLEVDTPGTYFAETNYGTCTSNSFSNRVMVTEVTSGEANAAIVSSLGNPYCPEQGLTTLSTLGGLSYQWFKDGTPIPGAVNQMYQTDESGVFSVQVDLGSCSASGSIDLESQLFESEINADELIELEEDSSFEVIVSSTANVPVYEWYFENSLIPNATSNSLEVFDFGDYEVVITETQGCEASVSYVFSVQEVLDLFPDVSDIPNIVSPNGDNINDTWILPQQYVTGTNTEVSIFNNRGQLVFKSNDYQNNWPQTDLGLNSINQIFYYVITTADNSSKKGSITIIR